MTKLFPCCFRTSPGGSGVSLNRRFLLYSWRPIRLEIQALILERLRNYLNSSNGACLNLGNYATVPELRRLDPEFPSYNIRMGRMRIKKKDAVIPFRETLAYRMILAGASLIVFVVAIYMLVGSLSTNMPLAIASGAIGVAAAFGIFYNLDHLREAKVPKRTMNRMKRR